jgi:hypothetical protein
MGKNAEGPTIIWDEKVFRGVGDFFCFCGIKNKI